MRNLFNDVNENISDNITPALDNKVDISSIGIANGVAGLDSNGLIPSSQLPSYVDDTIEGYLYEGKWYSDSSHTHEVAGETEKIYVELSTNKTYRWSGSVFVEISESLALGETSSTAYRGDRGKEAYDHSQSDHSGVIPTFIEASTRANIATGESIATIFGKIKKFFTDLKTVAFSGSYNDLSDKPDLSGKADIATSLSGYGITDAYTKSETDEIFVKPYKAGDSIKIEYNIPLYGFSYSSAHPVVRVFLPLSKPIIASNVNVTLSQVNNTLITPTSNESKSYNLLTITPYIKPNGLMLYIKGFDYSTPDRPVIVKLDGTITFS